MAEALTLLLLGLAFGVVGYGEWLLLTRARTVPARVLTLFTSVHRDESEVLGDHYRDLGRKAKVQLDPGMSDGREATIVLPPAIWGELSEGGEVIVRALPRRPGWAVWSPMVRYRQRPIWAKLAGGIAAVLVLLALVTAVT